MAGSSRLRTFWMDDPPAVERLRLRRLPMLLAGACFAAGIVLARSRWHTPFEFVASANALMLLCAWSLMKAPRVAWLPVLAFWCLAGCWSATMQPPIPQQNALRQYADGLTRNVEGTVTQVRPLGNSDADADPHERSEPWLAEPGAWEPQSNNARTSVDLQLRALEDVTPDTSTMRPATGGLRLTLGSSVPLQCGDLIELPVRLREPDVYRDPGAWSYRDFLLEQGIGAVGSAGVSERPVSIRVLGRAQTSWHCCIHVAQAWASGHLRSLASSSAEMHLPASLRLTPDDTGMLAAMLFGDRSTLQQPLRSSFERTGTFHLFVVSGLHITLLAGGLLWLLRVARVPYVAAALLSLLAAAAYAVLTGWGLPVQRALGMTALYLAARMLARNTHALNALGAAAVGVLVLDPRALFSDSFQMTFLIIFALGGLATPLQERLLIRLRATLHDTQNLRLDVRLPPTTAQGRVRLRMWSDLLASLALPTPDTKSTRTLAARVAGSIPWLSLTVLQAVGATLLAGLVAECCMVLPMAVYFHRATLLALPANLLCLPLLVVLLIAAPITFALALVSTKAALLPAMLLATMLHALRAVVSRTAAAPLADIRVPSPAPFALMLACAALLFALWALRREQRWLFAAATVALALAPAVALWRSAPELHANTLEVTALDVGQGDSLLVVSPEGRTLLVDAGGPAGMQSQADDRWDIGEEVVAPYLWSRRIGRLDAVMLTHAHSDHMGGMAAVLRDLRPRELWLGVQPNHSPGMLALRTEAADLGIAVRWFRAGDTFSWGGTQAQVLAPEREYANNGTAVNDDSLVMRLAYGKASVLLEGDAQARSEDAMLAHNRVEPSTLLKVGHHGSKTSTTPAFLAAVAPQDAVISVGAHNTFGHPRMEVLERLEAAHVKTARTDREGLETYLLTPDGRIKTLMSTP